MATTTAKKPAAKRPSRAKPKIKLLVTFEGYEADVMNMYDLPRYVTEAMKAGVVQIPDKQKYLEFQLKNEYIWDSLECMDIKKVEVVK